MTMRRSERAVTDPKKIEDILLRAQVLHLGLQDGDGVYVVPLHYGVVKKGQGYTLYCHSALEGRKLDLIGDGAKVGFAAECGVEIIASDSACAYSTRFESVIGEGRASLVRTGAERKLALHVLMEQYTERSDWDIPEHMLSLIQVIRIDVTAISGKCHEV